jgi:hypothetical protein
MTTVTQVFVLRAVNVCDFNENDIVVVGTSREAAERQYAKVLKDRWDNHLDKDDIEFYETLEKYVDAWNEQYDVVGLFS